MQIQREEINERAKPFLALECQWRDLGSLVLSARDNRDDVVRVLRGNKCHTKQDFFDEVAAVFQFPFYFGENWDAFEECINDLEEWLPATSYLLLIANAEQLLSMESPEQFAILIRILDRAAKAWKSGFNHARFVRASGQEGGSEKAEFAIGLQVNSSDDLTGNLGSWLARANIPRLKANNADDKP